MSSHIVARLRKVAERFRSVSRAASVVLSVLPPVREREEFESLQGALEKTLNNMVLLDGAELEKAVDAAEARVATLEDKFIAVDGIVPMSWFRERFDVSRSSSVALVDYVSLLGPLASTGDSSRIDRVQYLLTRLLAAFLPTDADSPADRRRLLMEALPPFPLDPAVLERASTFFQDAARRLSTFTTLKDFFDSGILIDVRGYKLSLRSQLLDPEVMAGVIELNEAIGRTIDALAERERTSERDLATQLAEVDARIKAIFAQDRAEETQRSVQLVRYLQSAQEAKAKGKRAPRLEDFGGPRRPPVNRTRVLGVAVALLAVLVVWRGSGSSRLVELPTSECSAASSVVVSCVVAPPANPRFFVGQVDGARWALMDEPSRREAAVALAGKVRDRGWLTGTVLLEDTVVMQVENGTVMVVH